MVKTLSFDTVSQARRASNDEYVFLVEPRELGLTPEQCGVSKSEKVGLRYRPITTAELAQVFLNIKDIKGDDRGPARDECIIQTCLTEPRLPSGASGSRVMQYWLPGTKANLAANIQNTSGYADHEVITADEAVDELGNSSGNDQTTTGS